MATNGVKEIKVSNTNYLIEPTLYTTIKQTSAAATFTADLANFELFTGVTVAVKFGVTNNGSATLNINGTGAKAIYYEGAAIAASKLKAKHTYVFTYNGTQWELIGDLDTDTNTHRPIQVNGTEVLGNNTTALNLKNGDNVSITNNSGTVTIAATDTTYTFENGTNGFKVTPLGGTAQTVTVTPSITNNITGSGTANYLTKFTAANTISATGIAIDSNNNLTIPSTLIKFTGLGEGLEITQNNNYFGTNYDARIISIIDSNPAANSAAVDGGLIIQAVGRVSNTDTIQELLRIRNHNGSADWKTGEFQWKTKDVVVETGKANKTWDISIAGDAATVSGHTVEKNVPSNAVFTDTKSFTITANATDGYWDLTGTSGTNAVTYALAPYSSKQSGASFYTGTANPDGTTRLNYNGYLYATKLYSGGNEVLTIQTKAKALSSIGWYRILDCTAYSMAFFITFYGNYNNQPPTPVTFLVSHAYNTTKIEQIGRSANIGWIQQLRAVHHDTSKFYIDVYYAGDKGNIGAFEITPLDPNARSNITLIDFTAITETVTANASCSTSLESHADKAEDANTVGGLTVKTAVPANAVFTDTNKYHKSGSWSGLTYTATAVNNADELKFTIPDNYGDTKNPYASKTKNYVLAAPSSANGVPSFRALVAADIPDISGTYLKLTGGTMTGNIHRYYSAASTEPMITMLSNNQDIILWEVGHGTSAATTTTSNHYKLLYKGTGNDGNNSNYLQLIAYKSNDSIAVQIDETGKITLPQMATGAADTPIYINNNGVITAGTKLGASALHCFRCECIPCRFIFYKSNYFH